MNSPETQSRHSVQRMVRRIPVDFQAIATETGMTRGKLCRSTWAGWVVQNTTGNPAWPDMATVTPPATEEGETLTIEENHWCVYAPNSVISEPVAKKKGANDVDKET